VLAGAGLVVVMVEAGDRVEVGAGAVVSGSKVAIGLVVVWWLMAASRARTIRLNASAFTCIDSRTGVPALPCRFRNLNMTSSMSAKL
jgi:hypothetical protein